MSPRASTSRGERALGVLGGLSLLLFVLVAPRARADEARGASAPATSPDAGPPSWLDQADGRLVTRWDLESFARELENKGLKLSDGPTRSSSGSVFAFVDAPEGYEIELIQRPKS